ncbi:MAG: N-(5'-phosphoribosyl)anthranilate isomerase, partial [Actinobacteria bacterium]|nr:N-(5'-phosphoribosyl)anthranilate isomerase [Actinomycetota bacterium]
MVKVKVCGITNLQDARMAAGSGADAVGLVFAESPRKLSVEKAREIAATLPDEVLKIGVFVDEEPEEVLR